MKNSSTLDKPASKTVARPLKVLVPLIKQDLRERARLRNEASETIEIKIGGELIEAKKQIAHGKWIHWLKSNFGISRVWGAQLMRAAAKCKAGHTFTNVSEMSGDERIHHMPKWTDDVKEEVKATREEMRQAAERREREDREDARQDAELKAEIKLAMRLIDIGYRVLATELHPDKKGGSHEAMQRLNEVRKKLKEAAERFDFAGMILERFAAAHRR